MVAFAIYELSFGHGYFFLAFFLSFLDIFQPICFAPKLFLLSLSVLGLKNDFLQSAGFGFLLKGIFSIPSVISAWVNPI